MVLRGTLAQLLLGLAIGIPIPLVGGQSRCEPALSVRFYDRISIVLAVLVLSAAAALAGFIAARRASSIDPMQALRIE